MGKRGIKKNFMSKRAEAFDKIQNEMAKIIKLSKIPRQNLIEKVGTCEVTYYRKLRLSTYTCDEIISYMRAIAEIKHGNQEKTE
jgi:hypothetical protein